MGVKKGTKRGPYTKPLRVKDKPECDHCGKKYKRRQSVLHHIKSKHNNEKIACSVCTKEYSSTGVYNRHLKVVS